MNQKALRALHEERFPEIPFDCGAGSSPGIVDEDEWRDWSAMETTADQYRIEHYIDRFSLGNSSLLHVGTGNSLFAARFAGRARLVVGTTVGPEELRRGEALARERGLANYRVILHNKYDGAEGCDEGPFDFIADNNPTTFCCCMRHLGQMLEWYADSLAPGGRFVTDRVGLGWTTELSNPRFAFTPGDLASVAALVGLRLFEIDSCTIVLSRSAPSEPTPVERLGGIARRARQVAGKVRRRLRARR